MKSKILIGFRLAFTTLLFRWRVCSLGKRAILLKPRRTNALKCLEVGDYTFIDSGWLIWNLRSGDSSGVNPTIKIGSFCRIMHDFQCNVYSSVVIGNGVLIGPRVLLTDSDHVVRDDDALTSCRPELITQPIKIENNVWIGAGAVILKGVTIGRNSIVGANSVVTKNVPEKSVVAGIPAKVIKQI